MTATTTTKTKTNTASTTSSTTSTRSARTVTVYASPGSFHSHLSQSSTSYPHPHHHHPSASVSLIGTTHVHAPGTLCSSLTSLFIKESNPSSSSRTTTANANAAAVNVKRLMSKPTAILPLPVTRAHSVPLQSSDTEDSATSHHAIKSNSLEILTRSKRRSRSLDILRATHIHTHNRYHNLDQEEEGPGGGQEAKFNTPLAITRPSQRQHPTLRPAHSPPLQRSGPSPHHHIHSPSAPTFLGSITVHPGNQVLEDDDDDNKSHRRRRRTSPDSAFADEKSSIHSPSPSTAAPTPTPRSSLATPIVSPVTPASAIALAWTESQKKTVSSDDAAGIGIPCDSAKRSSSPTILSASPVSARTTINAFESQVSLRNRQTTPGPLIDATTVIYHPSVADRILSPVERDEGLRRVHRRSNTLPSRGNGSIMRTKGANGNGPGVGSMSATVRGLSRRLTGAFGRKEKNYDDSNFQQQMQTADRAHLGIMASTSNTNVNYKQNSDSVFDSLVSEPWPVSKLPAIQTSSSNTSNQSNPIMFHELAPSTSRHPHHLGLHPTTVGPSAGAELVSPSDTSTFLDTTVVDNLKNYIPQRQLSLSSNSKRDVWQEGFSHQAALSPTTGRDSQLERLASATSPTPRPNMLRKHSRSNLRKKPPSAASIFVPAGSGNSINERRMQEQARDAHTIMSMSMAPAMRSTLSVRDSSEESPSSSPATGKLRSLVRKLSSGGLRRTSSQSGKLLMVGRASISSGNGGSLNGHREKAFVPPVPPLPKDFELILDAKAYFADRSRRREESVDSDDDNDSSAHGSQSTPRRPFGSPLKSSIMSSMLSSSTPQFHGPSEPAYAESPLSNASHPLPSPVPRHTGTEHIPVDHFIAPHGTPPLSRFVFPKRPKPKQDLRNSVGSTSYSISGTDHVGYRTSSPAPSSPEIPSNRNLGTNHDDMASLSSHEMGSSSLSHSMIAHPIMAPKELYQHGEEEAATLRIRQRAKGKADVALWRERANQVPGTSSPDREVEKELMSSRRKNSSTSMVPLGVPPPRPSRRQLESNASTGSNMDIKSKQSRPVHIGRKRSISSPQPLSPASPGVPVFSNADAINAIPFSKRSGISVGRHRSPSMPVGPPSPTIGRPSQTQTQAVRARSGSQTSSKSKHAKDLSPLQLYPTVVNSSANFVSSPHDANDTDSHSPRKLRLKTSMGALGRIKSLIGSAKSAPHTPVSYTPTSGISYSTFSPQSGSVSRGTTPRDRMFVDDGEMPPMPFTSTAFTFKEISPMTPSKGIKLTEGEREFMWNALLQRSERAGGTLTVALDQLNGQTLQSDNASFISTQCRGVQM